MMDAAPENLFVAFEPSASLGSHIRYWTTNREHWDRLSPTLVGAILAEYRKTVAAWNRDDLAVGLAALDGIVLHEVRSTVIPPEDANNWREYLGRADDLMARLSLRLSTPPSSPVSGEGDETTPEDRAQWQKRGDDAGRLARDFARRWGNQS